GAPLMPINEASRDQDERDLKVLTLYAEGISDTEITKRLGIPRNTSLSIRNRIRTADLRQSGEDGDVVRSWYQRGIVPQEVVP
ncbi:helix-turn-helix domain-containing protein, partial [Mangrovicoccus sp. HB161399]|uniref:helix-turn-helix domain-containing protein n=1 Tax=Mangrovicoccus sp. HB161399 TaxID=2720392 RepID=UPI001C12DDCA